VVHDVTRRRLLRTVAAGTVGAGTLASGVASGRPHAAADRSADRRSEWTRTFGGAGADGLTAVLADDSGGYLLAGNTTADGTTDGWLLSVDDAGERQWARTYGGDGDDRVTALHSVDGGSLLAGETASSGAAQWDGWLVRVDESGQHQWERTYGGDGFDHLTAVVDASTGFLLVGYTNSKGSGNYDAWLLQTDESGAVDWRRTHGGRSFDYADAAVATDDGGSLLAGHTNARGELWDAWLLKVDADGATEWGEVHGGGGKDYVADVVATDEGSLVAGRTDSWGSGGFDAWLLFVDDSGTVQWEQTYGGEGDDAASAVLKTDGGYVLAGHTTVDGTTSGWLVGVDDLGNRRWARTLSHGEYSAAASVIEADGDYLVAGQTVPAADAPGDGWLVKTAGTPVTTATATPAGTPTDTATESEATTTGAETSAATLETATPTDDKTTAGAVGSQTQTDASDTTAGTTTGTGPGLGALAGLAGVLGVSALARRSGDDESDRR
jgi:hypothetical protein